MKRTVVSALMGAVVLSLSLSACTGVTTSAQSPSPTHSASTSPAASPTPVPATPAATGVPAIPAKAPYLTSAGLATLRLGRKVPTSNPFVSWDAKICQDGGWKPKAGYGDSSKRTEALDIRTASKPSTKAGTLQWIVLWNSQIPTKSGVRVGDSIGTLFATYGKFDQIVHSSDTTSYVIEGTKGKMWFEVADGDLTATRKAGTIVAIALLPRDDKTITVVSTDGYGICNA